MSVEGVTRLQATPYIGVSRSCSSMVASGTQAGVVSPYMNVGCGLVTHSDATAAEGTNTSKPRYCSVIGEPLESTSLSALARGSTRCY